MSETAPPANDPPTPPLTEPRWARVRRAIAGTHNPLVRALLALLVLATIGRIVRDRWVASALLLYLPMLPLGAVAAALDLATSGRSLPRVRYGLLLIGLAAAAWECAALSGGHAVVATAATSPTSTRPVESIKVMQWNVMRGGRGNAKRRLPGLADDIAARDPDILVLSEAPPPQIMPRLMRRMPRPSTLVRADSSRHGSYEYYLTVVSPWPLDLVRQVPITHGYAIEVTVTVRDRPVRLLVVDGDSNVLRSRTPLLRDVIRTCTEAAGRGEPIDLIVGDFNSVGRSVGFDEFPRAGFTDAAAQVPGWRPTWPAWLPLYDIDHVWVGPGWGVESYEQFTNLSTDHRAQFARLRPPG